MLKDRKEDFIDFLLKGPAYSKEELALIKKNRKSISAWRTRLMEGLTIGEKSGFIKNFNRTKFLCNVRAKYLLK